MHSKTSDFMKRLRERAARMERKQSERLEDIMDRSEEDSASEEPARSVPWIKDEETDSVGRRKSSILDLIRGDVTTKSSTNRE